MLDKMKQMKDMLDLQRKAKAMQKELRETEIEGVSPDGNVTVVFNGEMKIMDLTIQPEYMEDHSMADLEKALKTTIQEAMSKAQAVAAERTRAIMKDMNINLPGM